MAFVDDELSPTAHDRAVAHLAGCAICAAEVAVQRQAASAVQAANAGSVSAEFLASLRALSENGVDTVLRTGTFPVFIYLADDANHETVEAAVTRVMELAGAPIVERDDPVLGSWFRRMRANPTARQLAVTAAHVADTRLVHGPDAQVTATLLQHIGPVITALQQEKEAVVRLGAVLIVKVDQQLMVHQLTAAQQFQLDHQPHMVAPRDILTALGLPPATNGHLEPGCGGLAD